MNQMPFTPDHHHPSFEAFPSQRKPDQDRCPPYYQSWPYTGNYGYPYPAQCHGCCDHHCFPGYFVPRPPVAHPPSPCYHGSYPVPPRAYPVHYIAPPHYTIEVPNYRSHGDIPGYSHCCGCPKQPHCKWTEGKNLKIEDEDPDTEKRANDSLVPFDVKNYPYPVVWIPPGYMNKENKKSNELQHAEKEKYFGAAKGYERSKPSEQQKNFWSGWFLFDSENTGLAKQEAGLTGKQQCQDEDKRHISVPLIWMPYNPDEMEGKDNAKANSDQECVQRTPAQCEITPVTFADAEHKQNTAKVSEETISPEHVQKIVPVMSAEPIEGRKTLENHEEKLKSSSTEHVNRIEERKSSLDSGKSKCSSPPKSSKLPPIYLRVDPLHIKKNNNGDSRSPSPPGDKGKLQELSKDGVQLPASSNAKEIAEREMTLREIVSEKTKVVEQHERKVKTIVVSEAKSREEGNKDLNIAHPHGWCSLPDNSKDIVVANQVNDKSEEVFLNLAAREVNVKVQMSENMIKE